MAGEKLFETRVKKWLAEQGVYAAGTPKNKMEAVETGWFFKVWGGGGQAWCRLFDQERPKPEIQDIRIRHSLKCLKCREACAKASE